MKKDLRKLKIGLSYEEITLMPKSSFNRLVKQKCEENALMFLKLHIKSKGKDITYEELEMRNYLKNKSLLRLQEKKEQGWQKWKQISKINMSFLWEGKLN